MGRIMDLKKFLWMINEATIEEKKKLLPAIERLVGKFKEGAIEEVEYNLEPHYVEWNIGWIFVGVTIHGKRLGITTEYKEGKHWETACKTFIELLEKKLRMMEEE